MGVILITVEVFVTMAVLVAVLTAFSVLIEYLTDEAIDRRISENNEFYDDADDWEDTEE